MVCGIGVMSFISSLGQESPWHFVFVQHLAQWDPASCSSFNTNTCETGRKLEAASKRVLIFCWSTESVMMAAATGV